MRDFPELRGDRPVELFFPVAVDRDPKGRYAVDISFPMNIGEETSFAALNDDLALVCPVSHLGKGVPEILFVEALQATRGGLFHGTFR